MPDWLIWLIVAGALLVAETLTLALVLGMAGAGALVAAAVAGLGGPVWSQFLAFLLVTLAGLLVVRPVARRHMHTPRELRTGTAALVGHSATVLEQVDLDGGRIRLAGEVWSARAFDERDVIAPGERVEVVQIDGATAVVLKEGA